MRQYFLNMMNGCLQSLDRMLRQLTEIPAQKSAEDQQNREKIHKVEYEIQLRLRKGSGQLIVDPE